MKTVTADQKRRVSLPDAEPGDVFDVQITSGGTYVLEKLIRPSRPKRPSADEVRQAMDAAPLTPSLSWDELRRQTREP